MAATHMSPSSPNTKSTDAGRVNHVSFADFVFQLALGPPGVTDVETQISISGIHQAFQLVLLLHDKHPSLLGLVTRVQRMVGQTLEHNDWTGHRPADMKSAIRSFKSGSQQAGNGFRLFGNGAVQDDSHGSLLIMVEQQDDGSVETRIAHAGRCNQQMTFK